MNKQLSNIKVLIAEDNEINELLVKRMLQLLQCDYKVARNGNEVLTMLQDDDFDVILMDIQLPEKDGVETTIEIRNSNNEKKKNIPIIALTANGLIGEEQKYKEAGMNGYLIKPFKEQDLKNILQRIVIDNSNLFNNIHTMSEKSTAKLYNMDHVSSLVQGNIGFIRNLAQIFLDTIPANCKELLQEVENKNWLQASKIAHKLKSTADTMQINEIKDDIRVIEANGKSATNTDVIPTLAVKVDTIIAKVAEQLKEEFEL